MIRNEFPGIEYEVKFNINPLFSRREYGRDVEFPTAIARLIDFKGTNRYEKSSSKHDSKTHYFFGTDDEEILVLMRNERDTYKIKKKNPPLEVEEDNRNLVIKRQEKEYSPAGLERVFIEVADAGKKYGTYRGRLVKDLTAFNVEDKETGRLYEIAISKCYDYVIGRDKIREKNVFGQLEIEYLGIEDFERKNETISLENYLRKYHPEEKIENMEIEIDEKGLRIKNDKQTEREIVQGLLDLSDYLMKHYNNKSIGKTKLGLHPTKKSKYDFILERKAQ